MAYVLRTRRIAFGSSTSTAVVIQARIMAQEEFLGFPPSRPSREAENRCHFQTAAEDIVEVLGSDGEFAGWVA